MKFDDGLANIVGKQPGAIATELLVPPLVNPHDLLTEVSAMQQSQKSFRHSLNALEYILFETNFSCTLPFGKMSERLISPMPPVKYQKPAATSAGLAAWLCSPQSVAPRE